MSTAFRVILEGSQETPFPTPSTASGLGTVIFDSTAVAASYSFRVQGVDFGPVLGLPSQTPADSGDDVTRVHFHNEDRGEGGNIVFGQIAPAHDADDLSIVLNSDGSWSISGRWETTDPTNPPDNLSIADFATVLGSARPGDDVPLYFNIHTSEFGSGEIRGQLVAIADDRNNVVKGTAEDDLLPGLGGHDIVLGRAGDDMLLGGDGRDHLYGGIGDDMLDGGAGTDFLFGGAGDDVLTGGAGIDLLVGWSGEDTYNFASPADGGDRIVGFRSGTDTIQINVLDPAMVTFRGFEDSMGSGPTMGPTLSYSDRTGLLHWDPTGGPTGDRVLIARLVNSPELVSSDVLLI